MTKEISLQIDEEEIIFADFTNRENIEFVSICKSGNVYLFDCETNEPKLLGDIEFPLKYSEAFFEYSELISSKREFLQIQSFNNYVSVVQKYGQNGLIFDLNNPKYKKELKRGDYFVEHCTFPIAFYSQRNATFLIHGTDWNRLDITCLETDELLTDRGIDYETDSNYFDYFHSYLSISPYEKHFTSNGWIWHPYGQITLYSIDKFLENFELSHKDIHLADDCYSFDWDRPLCWIDENTLAIGFSRNTEEYGKTDFPDEILFVDIVENKIINQIEFNGFGSTSDGDVFGELFYDKESSRLISLNEKKGLFVSDLESKKMFEDRSLISHKYSGKHKLLYKIDYNNKMVNLEKI
ncbi:MAG TPA: hypothetical protein VF556_14260 [Pyrinomonadaceae bacterium]|jgi:hypothetical protein